MFAEVATAALQILVIEKEGNKCWAVGLRRIPPLWIYPFKYQIVYLRG